MPVFCITVLCVLTKFSVKLFYWVVTLFLGSSWLKTFYCRESLPVFTDIQYICVLRVCSQKQIQSFSQLWSNFTKIRIFAVCLMDSFRPTVVILHAAGEGSDGTMQMLEVI